MAGENHPLYCAIRKYGFEAFTVDVVQVCTPDMLDEWEVVWTAALNALHPNGYSLTIGGQRARRSAEVRRNMSRGRRGVRPNLSPDARCRMGRKGEPKPVLSVVLTGRKLLDEHKNNISLGLLGTHQGPRPQEVKDKISQTLTGRKQSFEHVEAARLGRLRAKQRRLEEQVSTADPLGEAKLL